MAPCNVQIPVGDPVEFSVEDAMLNAWVEDTGVYLSLETDDSGPEPLTAE